MGSRSARALAPAEISHQLSKRGHSQIGEQEAGILHLMKAKDFFQRMKVPEPRWEEDGTPIWDVSEKYLTKVYGEAKKCCDPEWSYHPKRDVGLELLNEAMETLCDRNGR